MSVLVKIIRWIVGLFFILGGLGGFMSDEMAAGLIMTVIGLAILPISLWKKKKKEKPAPQSQTTAIGLTSDRPKSKITRNGNTTTITIDSDAILQNVLAKRQARQEEIDNYDYQYRTVQGWSLQLLESLHLLHTTKNFDTLKGRYDFINQFYYDLCLAKHNKRYTADIQKGIDNFKSTYYETTLQDFEIDLLYNPDQKKLKELYLRSIGNCFELFAADQALSLANLKRDSAKRNRLDKIYEVADQSIREIDNVDLYGDLGKLIANQIRETRDKIANNYNPKETSELPSSMDQLVVNPQSSFPLTIYNASNAKLRKVAKLLQSDEYNKNYKLMPLFAEHNIKCLEIENYIHKYKAIYLQRIEDEKEKSTEYQQSTEMDRLDMESEYKDKAVKGIYEIANCDLKELFDYKDIPLTIDDQLIKEYGFDNFSLYMKLQSRVGKVITNWERKDIEDLGKTNLVSMIDEIEIDEVLLTLPLKVLNAIAEKEEGHFKRKKKAVDYINEQDLSANLGKHIATRRIFKVNPLPSKYDHVDIDLVVKSWAYLKEYLNLFVDTYFNGESYKDRTSHMSSYIEGWKVEPGYQDSCPRAREECKKTYSRSNPPKLPFHVGCTCNLRSQMRDF